MKIEEALKYADAATQGATFYEGMTGPLMTMAALAAEVRRYQKQEAEAIQNKLDDETRKLVLELCDYFIITNAITRFPFAERTIGVAKMLRKKLGTTDEN